MEEVYKKGSKYFGMSSGKEYSSKQVKRYGGAYWHCHPMGAPVVEVGEYEGDTRPDYSSGQEED